MSQVEFMGSPLYWVQANVVADHFPDTTAALTEPDGLLAAGGDLKPDTLLSAYRNGIFPWFSEGQPILWWAPDPRSVLYPKDLKISRSLRKTLRREVFTTTFDREFVRVVDGCAAPRSEHPGTWITDSMRDAYITLHQHGYAHSVECWHGAELVGGLYGVAIGCVFFGESMFSRESDASKVAMVALVEHLTSWGYRLIDCQVHNPHLESLGASTIKRDNFNAMLNNYCNEAPLGNAWRRAEIL